MRYLLNPFGFVLVCALLTSKCGSWQRLAISRRRLGTTVSFKSPSSTLTVEPHSQKSKCILRLAFRKLQKLALDSCQVKDGLTI